VLYAPSMKPGQVKSGKTFVKLSSLRDPYYSAKSIMDLVENAESNVGGIGDDEGDDDWRWEAEEDFTVGHVWESGPTYGRPSST